ncbi:MAG: YifB family Mg chelatase-like AAA ATPase [Candidatus Latescibacteria bacterium]|nr:YifB family Mg chelatase-like AAA ATPase [Candidatus Latescibacterota bacterium]
MMAVTHTASVMGIDGYVVRVEVDITQGLPAFVMVGLAEGAVRESRVRVSSAIRNAGYMLPMSKIVANLAPADVRKEGSGFDLPLAVAILGSLGHIGQGRFGTYALAGELSLDGDLRSVPGAFPMALACHRSGFKGLIVPEGNAAEAALVDGLDVRCARLLREVAEFMNGTGDLPRPDRAAEAATVPQPVAAEDFRDVAGQHSARRAMEIAAAGGHSFLLIGPPGAGKSMLARRLPSILPPLYPEESLETTKIWSVAGHLDPSSPLITRPPFRAPHHTITSAALAGGGVVPRPGEISLAHNGVLFLDELPEFTSRVLEILRQPLEDGRILLVRSAQTYTFPSRFLLAAAMNPCPCGFRGHPTRPCTCTAIQIRRYRVRISGPLLDRVDLHVDVPPVEVDALERGEGEPSALLAERVARARKRTQRRLRSLPGAGGENLPTTNAMLTPSQLRRLPRLEDEARRILSRAARTYSLTARTYHRLLKVAWTIADLEGSPGVSAGHVSEAIHYRVGERERVAVY